jgi:hypothetical protein
MDVAWRAASHGAIDKVGAGDIHPPQFAHIYFGAGPNALCKRAQTLIERRRRLDGPVALERQDAIRAAFDQVEGRRPNGHAVSNLPRAS